ncbi:MAG: ATPase domain containing protein [Candidatus Magnetoglobus multicellularis str. Araruama]|uniref:ATPase domain containing protein n=1 Tax=Candidatus Magnetoglobus multicellularis str. Araruama TaxID=890399 RepID=A0A1V1PCI8_9BACT|nr:MAG: ATPase domain containing protein [Candidatus Magnetoglobus multicellularis str. Araruama]
MKNQYNTINPKQKYTLKTSFVNRYTEMRFLYNWINQEPNYILFMYGPKSSGKTTLLMKFIESIITNKTFDIKHFNLRKMLVSNYKDFIQSFFEIDFHRSKDDVKEKKEYNLKVFKLTKEIMKGLNNKEFDPFIVMDKELQKLQKKGKRPIIIIDELQSLRDIYMNGQRELLKELFNFFVAITKESHLCHVIVSCSDGYFMKRIYEDSYLTKTSEFFEVEYLNEQDIKHWLANIETENDLVSFKLSDSQIETIWKYLGGSIWEIYNTLSRLVLFAQKNKVINDNDLMSVIQRLIKMNAGRFNHYAGLYQNRFELLKHLYQLNEKHEECQERNFQDLITKGIYENKTLKEDLSNLVQLNFLAYNPITSFYKLQGKSMYYGLKEYIENM